MEDLKTKYCNEYNKNKKQKREQWRGRGDCGCEGKDCKMCRKCLNDWSCNPFKSDFGCGYDCGCHHYKIQNKLK